MALPMVHLAVAHRLVCSCGLSSLPAYYLGSISPDAIHKRPGAGSADKQVVHLYRDDEIDLDRVRALFAGDGPVSQDAAFTAGYGIHLLTDAYWVREVVQPLYAKLGEQMSRREWRTLYYAECDKIDLDLYDGQPWRGEVWALLRSAAVRGFRGLLSQGEIEQWRDRVLSWYNQNRDKGDYVSQYLSVERVLDFIADASARVCEQMAVWGR